MAIEIKPVQEFEIGLLAQVSRQAFYDTFAAANKASDMELFLAENLTPGKLRRELDNRDNRFYFAWLDGEVTGILKLSAGNAPAHLSGQTAMEISRLYAVKNQIGKGIGKALMEFAVAEAKRQNITVLWLGVWEENERAIRFYEKFGFAKFGEHDFVLGKDVQTDWLMKKEL